MNTTDIATNCTLERKLSVNDEEYEITDNGEVVINGMMTGKLENSFVTLYVNGTQVGETLQPSAISRGS